MERESVRFSFSSASFPSYSLDSVFELGYLAGADAIEIMLTPRLARGGATKLRRLEELYKIPIGSIHTIMRVRRPGRDQEIDDVLESARFAREFSSCHTLVAHLPWSRESTTSVGNQWIRAIDQVKESLAGSTVSLSLENPDPATHLNPNEQQLLLMRWTRLVEEFELCATLDTSHAAACGWNLLELASSHPASLDNVHLSDIGGRTYRAALLNSLLHEHRRPGTGELEIERFLARLIQTDFNGLITLEISPLRVPWYRLRSAQMALAEMLHECRRATGDVRSIHAQSPGLRRSRSRIDR